MIEETIEEIIDLGYRELYNSAQGAISWDKTDNKADIILIPNSSDNEEKKLGK